MARRRRNKTAVGPAAGATSYSGPISVPRNLEDEMRVVELIYTGYLTSTAGGVLQWYCQNDGNNCVSLNGGSTVALTDFTDWATVYLQYRILGLKFEYCPASHSANMIVNGTSLSMAPVECIMARQDTALGVVTSYAVSAEYPNVEQFALNERYARSVKMHGPGESEWVDTSGGTPTDYYGISLYATGLSTSQNYGRYKLTAAVQFRVRA